MNRRMIRSLIVAIGVLLLVAACSNPTGSSSVDDGDNGPTSGDTDTDTDSDTDTDTDGDGSGSGSGDDGSGSPGGNQDDTDPPPVTFIVTTAEPTGPGSLSEALSDAEDGDIIVFDDSYTITAPATLVNPPNWFSISESVTLDAEGHTVILDANEAGRHFLIENAATLTLIADEATGGSLELRNGRGEDSGASVVGGSVRVEAEAELVTENVSFTDNRTMPGEAANSGGGAISISGGASITGGTFSGNMTATWGGAIVMQGSATGTLHVRDAIFQGNIGGDLGSGSYDGGAIHIGAAASATIRDSHFEENSVTGGGGAIGSYGELIVAGSTFVRNDASLHGGALEAGMAGSRARITGSRFYGNSAEDGGAIASTFSGVPAPYGQVIVSSSVFVGNLGLNGATFNAEVMRSEGNDVIVTSTVIGNARATNYVAFSKAGASNRVQVRSSILRASTVGSFVDLHNTLQNVPDFVRTPSPGTDGVWGTEDDDYGDLQLLSTSDAIDSGNNNDLRWDFADLNENGITTEDEPYDIAGNPRVVNATVDQGAYEYED